MNSTDTVDLLIDEKAHSYARIYASLLSDEYQRKRAYASITALYAFINKIEKTNLHLQKSMTLFRNPLLNEQYEISDVYINNWHIDVRIVTGGDAVLVPKIHYDSDIVPDFYVVVKVDAALKNAELVGIADNSSVQKEPFDYHYFSIPFSNLISYDEFIEHVKFDKELYFSSDIHDLFREKYLGLLDNSLDLHTKNKIIRHLFECPECRTEFCCFTGFEMVSCNASKYSDILEDHTLGVIGAQNVNDKKYEGKEETIFIEDKTDKEENSKDNSENKSDENDSSFDEENEETISDILDELFGEEEEFISSAAAEDKPLETQTSIENIVVTDDKNEEKDVSNDIQIIEDDKTLQKDLTSDEIQTIEDVNDMEIIEENDDSSAIDKISAVEEKEMQVLYEDEESEHNTVKELNIIEPEDNLEFENSDDASDFVIIDNSDDDNVVELDSNNLSSEIANIGSDAETVSDKDNIEKVIIDYDEFGEPIYSYITGINQQDLSDIDYETVPEPENDEKIEEYSDADPEPVYEDEKIEEYSGSLNDEQDNENLKTENIEENILADSDDIKSEIYEENLTPSDIEQEIPLETDDEQSDSDYNNYNSSDTPNEEQSVEEEQVINQNKEEKVLSDKILIDDEDESAEEYKENDNTVLKTDENADSENTSEQDSENVFEENEDENDEAGEYDDYDIEDVLPEENTKRASSKPVLIIISLLVILGLISGGVFFFMKNSKSNSTADNTVSADNNVLEIPNQNTNDMFEQPLQGEEINISENNEANQTQENQPVENTENQTQTNENNQENTFPMQGTIPVPPLTESDLIKPASPQSHGDVNKAIANAFSQNANLVSFRGLNWFCTSELFSDSSFKNYLQELDNKLKQNLKNNILNATETPPKDSVAAKFAVDNNGNLQKVIISDSSGSEEIDNIVLQSIKESFEGEKSQILNDSTLKANMYYLKVVIKL